MTMDLYTHVLKEHQVSEMEKLENNFDELNEKSENIINRQFDNQQIRNIIHFTGDKMVAK